MKVWDLRNCWGWTRKNFKRFFVEVKEKFLGLSRLGRCCKTWKIFGDQDLKKFGVLPMGKRGLGTISEALSCGLDQWFLTFFAHVPLDKLDIHRVP